MSDTRVGQPSPSGGDPAVESPIPARALLRGLWRPALVVIAIALLIILVNPREAAQEIEETRQWFRDLGVLGPALYIGFFVVATVCVVPQSVLKIGAGAVFGWTIGIVVASIGSLLGATSSFLIARYVARGSLLQRLKRRPKFQRLDRLAGEHGRLIVAASRLLPLFPANFLNYAFGLTQLRVKTFMLWTWLCMLPSVVVLVVGADVAYQMLEDERVPVGLVAMMAVAVAAILVAIGFAYRAFRKAQRSAAATDASA